MTPFQSPGEISLADYGSFFSTSYRNSNSALEVLLQPLEDGMVTISRSAGKLTLPCEFMLIEPLPARCLNFYALRVSADLTFISYN